jgi:mannose-6-phosphate isomerase-like protein (cupin superfamily)
MPPAASLLQWAAMEVRKIQDEVRFSPDKMQKVPLFGSDHYFCDLYCLTPGQEQRIHSHTDSDKIYCVIEGTGTVHIAGEEREITVGEAVVSRPGQDHGVRNDSGEKLVLLVFMTPRP